MTIKQYDRVQEVITTTGTGSFSGTGSASTGFRGFAAAVTSGDQVSYCCDDNNGNYEVGQGIVTLTGGANFTLTRAVVVSSNANSLVSFASGNKNLFLTPTSLAFAASGSVSYSSQFSQGVIKL